MLSKVLVFIGWSALADEYGGEMYRSYHCKYPAARPWNLPGEVKGQRFCKSSFWQNGITQSSQTITSTLDCASSTWTKEGRFDTVLCRQLINVCSNCTRCVLHNLHVKWFWSFCKLVCVFQFERQQKFLASWEQRDQSRRHRFSVPSKTVHLRTNAFEFEVCSRNVLISDENYFVFSKMSLCSSVLLKHC